MKRNKVLFSGYYGMENFGDDLFGIACILGAQEYWPRVDAKLFRPARSKSNDPFFKEYSAIKNKCLSSCFDKDKGVKKACRPISMAYHSLKSDYLILGGGSLLSSAPSKVRDLQAKMSSLNLLNVAGVGLSIGPFNSAESEEKTKEFLKRFKYLSVRDEASYEFAKSLNLECDVVPSKDLAGVIPELAAKSIGAFTLNSRELIKSKNKTIGFAPCLYESYTGGDISLEEERNRKILEGLIEAAKLKNANVNIFSLNNNSKVGDVKFAKKIEFKLKEAGIKTKFFDNSKTKPLEIWSEIAKCSFFLSIRLHGAICAYLSGVSFSLVEYHIKCTNYLDDICQDKYLRISKNPKTSNEVTEVLVKGLDEKPFPLLNKENYMKESMKHFSAADIFYD